MAASFNTSGLSFSGNPFSFIGGPARSRSAMSITPSELPAPEAPDMSELLAAYSGLPRLFNPRALLRNMDSAIDASETATAQTGRNAATSYIRSLRNLGVNTAGAGVVEAQARRAGNENTRALMSERENVAMEARKNQASIQAMIANNLAGIRNDYVKTVADYNSKKASLKYTADAANAGNALSYDQLEQQREMQAAQLAAQLGSSGAIDPATGMPVQQDVITPGYIPNSGPIIPATINGRTLTGQVISPSSVAAMGYRIG